MQKIADVDLKKTRILAPFLNEEYVVVPVGDLTLRLGILTNMRDHKLRGIVVYTCHDSARGEVFDEVDCLTYKDMDMGLPGELYWLYHRNATGSRTTTREEAKERLRRLGFGSEAVQVIDRIFPAEH